VKRQTRSVRNQLENQVHVYLILKQSRGKRLTYFVKMGSDGLKFFFITIQVGIKKTYHSVGSYEVEALV
jgi:hypothetical protein